MKAGSYGAFRNKELKKLAELDKDNNEKPNYILVSLQEFEETEFGFERDQLLQRSPRIYVPESLKLEILT